MLDTHKDLLGALRAAPAVFEALLHGCTQQEAQTARGGDEGWSVIEIACHLRDAEERALERTRLMRDETDPVIAAYDQERWAKERNYATADLREALAAFAKLRARHVAVLAALAPDDWERTGQHAERGRITIGNRALLLVCHDLIHAAQMAQSLGKPLSGETQ